MRFSDFLREQKEKHAVMAFGRLNPITVGHEKLVNKVQDIAKKVGGSAHIVVSHTQDSKKNPLSSAQKLKHAKRAFPGINVSSSDSSAPNFLAQAAKLHKQGVTHFHMVGGSDRADEYHKLLHKYNGVKGPHGSFNFKKIEVHSAGDRDPDAEGVEGMSASKMREHASKNNFKEFRKGVPSNMTDSHAKEMFNDVRKGMSIKESVMFEDEARVPKKPGQPDKSDKHSDLYTDEDPKDTIHGLKFATKEDAEASVRKIKSSDRSHAHKIQAAIAMEQRARVMGKTSAAAVYRGFINSMKEKTKDVNEEFEEILIEGVHDKAIFKAIFLAGGPGSGKDYVLDNTLAGQGLTEINSDKALEFLMDKEGLDKTMPADQKEARDFVRSRAKNMTELKQRLALSGRNGLIINGTGDDHEKIKRIKSRLEEIGYDTSMIMVNTDNEVSAQRNIERGQRGGRTVPEDVRRQKWEAVQNSRPELAKLFGDRYIEFDNSQDLRTASPDVVKEKKDEMTELYKNTQQFIAQPPKSEASQSWIANALEASDRLPVPESGAELPPHQGSNAANEARSMGLQYYGFGRYGQNGKVMYRSVHDKLVKVEKTKTKDPNVPVTGSSMKKNINEEFEEVFNEDLRKWFSKTDPAGDWKRINSKGEVVGPCAREPGEPKPKCMSRAKRESLTKKERAAAVSAKRRHDPDPERKGEPINVSNYGKGKISESYQLSDSGAINLLLLGTKIDEVNFDNFEEEKKEIKLFKDKSGKVRTFMLRRAAAKEAHIINGTVMPYKNGYVIKLNEENNHVQSTNQLSKNQIEGRYNEGVAELTTSSEYSRGEGVSIQGTNQEATGKITLAKIRSKQKAQVKESIDKGIEPGLSMSGSGENLLRKGLKTKQNVRPFEETIGAGGEDANSISDKKEDELKKVGINLQSFKAKRPVG
jgi:predicted ABC-type ATPase